MKNTRNMKILILSLVFLAVGFTLSAQTATATVTINDVALMAVNTDTMPTFTVDDPGAAGSLPLISSSGGPTYLQYTVIVASGDTMRITAACDKAMLDGLKLDVWAADPTGTGGVGTPEAGGLTVGTTYTPTTAVDLITGITSCATGNGTTQGPAVYYTLSIDAATFADMVTVANEVFTITYSLTGP